jgi:hypothetical protein
MAPPPQVCRLGPLRLGDQEPASRTGGQDAEDPMRDIFCIAISVPDAALTIVMIDFLRKSAQRGFKQTCSTVSNWYNVCCASVIAEQLFAVCCFGRVG